MLTDTALETTTPVKSEQTIPAQTIQTPTPGSLDQNGIKPEVASGDLPHEGAMISPRPDNADAQKAILDAIGVGVSGASKSAKPEEPERTQSIEASIDQAFKDTYEGAAQSPAPQAEPIPTLAAIETPAVTPSVNVNISENKTPEAPPVDTKPDISEHTANTDFAAAAPSEAGIPTPLVNDSDNPAETPVIVSTPPEMPAIPLMEPTPTVEAPPPLPLGIPGVEPASVSPAAVGSVSPDTVKSVIEEPEVTKIVEKPRGIGRFLRSLLGGKSTRGFSTTPDVGPIIIPGAAVANPAIHDLQVSNPSIAETPVPPAPAEEMTSSETATLETSKHPEEEIAAEDARRVAIEDGSNLGEKIKAEYADMFFPTPAEQMTGEQIMQTSDILVAEILANYDLLKRVYETNSEVVKEVGDTYPTRDQIIKTWEESRSGNKASLQTLTNDAHWQAPSTNIDVDGYWILNKDGLGKFITKLEEENGISPQSQPTPLAA